MQVAQHVGSRSVWSSRFELAVSSSRSEVHPRELWVSSWFVETGSLGSRFKVQGAPNFDPSVWHFLDLMSLWRIFHNSPSANAISLYYLWSRKSLIPLWVRQKMRWWGKLGSCGACQLCDTSKVISNLFHPMPQQLSNTYPRKKTIPVGGALVLMCSVLCVCNSLPMC